MTDQARASRVVGILGGMGPAATVDFYDKLVNATPAATDQEHLRVVIWADPTIPNRHDAILGAGDDPRPALERGVDNLITAGAELLVVPCNTVHAFMDDVVAGKDIEFISIIDVTVDALRSLVPTDSTAKVGVVAADGAVASGQYQRALAAAGMQAVLPSSDSQAALMQLIYGVKAGDTGRDQSLRVAAVFAELIERGATSIIAGCTEISMLVDQLDTPVPVVDPSQVLAAAAVKRARASTGDVRLRGRVLPPGRPTR